MTKIVVQGGKRLHGRVAVSGSKNAGLPLLFASLLTRQRCTIRGLPRVADITNDCPPDTVEQTSGWGAGSTTMPPPSWHVDSPAVAAAIPAALVVAFFTESLSPIVTPG